MSKYLLLVSIISWSIIILVLQTVSFNDRLQKLEQKGTFTVVCGKYKYRDSTHNYEGYDCKLLGGETNDK